MLFIDKYVPTSIDNSAFHGDLLNILTKMSEDASIPNIMFYGPCGSGKKTVIRLLLELMYSKDVNNIRNITHNIKGSGNKLTPIQIKTSDYHIVIEPNNNNFDRYLIQNIVKEYAKKNHFDFYTNKTVKFKTILIDNIDNMSSLAQSSLRRTMEKYSKICRFIISCHSMAKVIEPLKSRCVCLSVPAPSNRELFKYITTVCAKDKIKIKLPEIENILEKSNGNIKTALWCLQLLKLGYSNTTSYDICIKNICQLILKHDVNNLLEIRKLVYDIMITNIEGASIISSLTMEICKNDMIKDIQKYFILEASAKSIHNIIRCRRDIINIESFIITVMKLVHEGDKLLKE